MTVVLEAWEMRSNQSLTPSSVVAWLVVSSSWYGTLRCEQSPLNGSMPESHTYQQGQFRGHPQHYQTSLNDHRLEERDAQRTLVSIDVGCDDEPGCAS